jgi:hypothetical protein
MVDQAVNEVNTPLLPRLMFDHETNLLEARCPHYLADPQLVYFAAGCDDHGYAVWTVHRQGKRQPGFTGLLGHPCGGMVGFGRYGDERPRRIRPRGITPATVTVKCPCDQGGPVIVPWDHLGRVVPYCASA